MQNNHIDFQSFLINNHAAIQFLLEHNLLPIPECNSCRSPTTLSKYGKFMDGFCFRCSLSSCKMRHTIRRGFWNIGRIRIGETVFIIFHGIPKELTLAAMRSITGLTINTIIMVKQRFWQLLHQFYFVPALFGLIGEYDGVVECDQSKFKRK